MYDKYLIVPEEVKNIEENGQVVGFQFGARLPYYRGVVCSLVGPLEVTLDGERIPADKLSVTLHGNTYTYDELTKTTDDKWEFGEIGIVKVQKPGGLTPGEHKLATRQHMKISYVPGGFIGGDAKTLTITK